LDKNELRKLDNGGVQGNWKMHKPKIEVGPTTMEKWHNKWNQINETIDEVEEDWSGATFFQGRWTMVKCQKWKDGCTFKNWDNEWT
jgi:hypothetical protein